MGYLKKSENGITYKIFLSNEDLVEEWVEVENDDPELLNLLNEEPDLKKEKIREFKTIRDQKETGGFSYLGKTFDSDEKACQRIAIAAQNALAALMTKQEFPPIEWTCQDNTTINLNAQMFLGLSAALAEHSARIHGIYNHLKILIEESKVEELEKILWPDPEEAL